MRAAALAMVHMGMSRLTSYLAAVRRMSRLLDRPVTPEESRTLIRQRVDARDERFLAFAARYIYGYPASPYLPLLRRAGCAYGDLEAEVRQRGLERTLETLRDEGVYFSFEEFKGRVDVVRNGLTLRVGERDFDNPFTGADVEARTGGTRGPGSSLAVGLNFMAETYAPGLHAALEAIGAPWQPIVLWLPALTNIRLWFVLTFMRRAPLRCFGIAPPDNAAAVRRRRALTTTARLLARRRGVRLSNPEESVHARPEDVLETLLATRRERKGCVLLTIPSAAVRLVGLARRRGESLADVIFVLGGEPLTAGKAEEIRSAGGRAGSIYVFTEAGLVGVPCGRPAASDDVHLRTDAYALIRRRRPMPGIGELDAYVFTTLADSPPKIMLNAEMDDFGEVATRRCGCVLDDLGLHTHLSAIRSFTKLTGEGAALLGTDVVRILEEVLPREFGGQSVDYQLLEMEDDEHITRLYLVISPEVGTLDERRVLDRFTAELRRFPSQGQHLWFQADTLQVVRRRPVLTPMGKVLPFHTQAITIPRDAALAGAPGPAAP